MIESGYMFGTYRYEAHPIIRPNLITGEGRCKCRPFSAYKSKDNKKKVRRRMAKISRRKNRGTDDGK